MLVYDTHRAIRLALSAKSCGACLLPAYAVADHLVELDRQRQRD
jgi:hypothetical protein